MRNITMAMISDFTTVDRMAHNSRKFAFTLSPTNYGYWKTMIEPFPITNNLMGYVDGLIPCLSKTLSVTDGATVPKENPNYPIWVSNDAHNLKTQLLRIEMHSDETPDAYLNHAQEYADTLVAIDEPVKNKDLVMLYVSGLREEYNGLKTTITSRQSPTVFSELHALLSDHDYMLVKTRAPASLITSSFAANYAVGSPSMPEARQAQLSELTAQLSALEFQVSPIAPSGPQAFYDTEANSHVTPDLEAMDNSEAYYGDSALHFQNDICLPIPHIGSSKPDCGQTPAIATTPPPSSPPYVTNTTFIIAAATTSTPPPPRCHHHHS
uniref:Ribonuclease H-like domain-containing protein n=1 Tax=Tanacetum cinerariifolium TaxID=118510 RepID=A0A6L2P1J1_TANCI|nr:ribonuclease H-like domain-containing protein [Tanacetum cinerariifolium]